MIVFLRMRRAAVIAGCAIALSLGFLGVTAAAQAQAVGTPSSAARFAAEATSHQNAVIAQVMARVPGGTRESATEVKWADGVILKVAASTSHVEPATYEDCDAGYFCANPDAYNGYWIELPNYILNGGVPYFWAWGDCNSSEGYGCDVGIHSWANNTGQRVWLEQRQDSGNELCISNHTYNLDYNGADDLDYWIYLSNNSAAC